LSLFRRDLPSATISTLRRYRPPSATFSHLSVLHFNHLVHENPGQLNDDGRVWWGRRVGDNHERGVPTRELYCLGTPQSRATRPHLSVDSTRGFRRLRLIRCSDKEQDKEYHLPALELPLLLGVDSGGPCPFYGGSQSMVDITPISGGRERRRGQVCRIRCPTSPEPLPARCPSASRKHLHRPRV
jgi:hypothetical protein